VSLRLRPADRELFALISQAAFENPFGVRRLRLDAEITERPEDDPTWVQRMLERVGARIRSLDPTGKVTPRAFISEEREIVEHTLLFEIFHRFADRFDELIERQRIASPNVVRVEFASDFLRELSELGIADERARRLLELFYQMRRAYYFIARGLIGKSSAMQTLRVSLWDAVFTCDINRYERYLWNRMEDFSTLLLGETGTGKGAAAAAIGFSGFIPFDEKQAAFVHGLKAGFVPIHLNEFPETLFESEIFGHRKGSFTGAIENYEGALARCPAFGSVFFDEIGEATLPVQVKLLRVLQDRSYSPVGSREPRRFSGRILAATHRSIADLRERGALRDDFFYRLCSNVIHVPSLEQRLSERPAELGELVAHLCVRIAGEVGAELSSEVTRTISRDLGDDYAFPGNVRELEQCVRRVLLTGSCACDSLLVGSRGQRLASELMSGALSAEAVIERYCALLYEREKSYVKVARRTGLDRRTVKKYVTFAERHAEGGLTSKANVLPGKPFD
jgi:DNA-binding NtrC family response regulator